MKTEDIARIAHEVNLAYCASIGDHSQVPWDDAPEWQKDSAMAGVNYHHANPGARPDDSHNSWMEQKRADGWKWGATKDPSKKEHPCFLPYHELPADQKTKDYLFIAVVRSCEEVSP